MVLTIKSESKSDTTQDLAQHIQKSLHRLPCDIPPAAPFYARERHEKYIRYERIFPVDLVFGEFPPVPNSGDNVVTPTWSRYSNLHRNPSQLRNVKWDVPSPAWKIHTLKTFIRGQYMQQNGWQGPHIDLETDFKSYRRMGRSIRGSVCGRLQESGTHPTSRRWTSPIKIIQNKKIPLP